jgi:hypothetical protein
MPPRVMTEFGHLLRQRMGNVYFAGTETAVKSVNLTILRGHWCYSSWCSWMVLLFVWLLAGGRGTWMALWKQGNEWDTKSHTNFGKGIHHLTECPLAPGQSLKIPK